MGRATSEESSSVPVRSTQSKPSATRSTRRSLADSSISSCGCRARKVGKAGNTTSRAMALDMSTRSLPLKGCPPARNMPRRDSNSSSKSWLRR
jgi:hypothetical protein